MDVRDAAEQAARRGIDFLLNQQGDDGMWRDFTTPAGEASCWPTGFVLCTLGAARADAVRLTHAARSLGERQQPDGGWGYNESTPSDADSTSWAVLALSGDAPRFSAARAGAAAFLRRHRRPNGGMATYADAAPIRRYTSLPRWLPFRGWRRPTIEVSATATRALQAIDGAAPNELGWRYVRSKQRPDGSWGAYWWTTPHLATQQAVMLGASLGDAGAIGRAAGWATRVLDPHGAAFHAALCLSIVAVATPGDVGTINRAIEMLQRVQLADGSWPSTPILRIPVPADTADSDHRGWRPIRFDGGLEVADQHRTFTTATCIAALLHASRALTGGAQR
ncbi:MAG TPA: prenyltransferase/squalene oxidase repeat-containing protein [Gemmatimonadaceae bacterium]